MLARLSGDGSSIKTNPVIFNQQAITAIGEGLYKYSDELCPAVFSGIGKSFTHDTEKLQFGHRRKVRHLTFRM